jgi:hypothetical protein
MNSLPIPTKKAMKASGGPAPVTLMEVLTIGNALYCWSDASIVAPSVLYSDAVASGNPSSTLPHPMYIQRRGGNPSGFATYSPWILKPLVLTEYKTTQTSTFSVSVQNLTGDTVRRDVSRIMATQVLVGALVYFQIFKVSSATAIKTFLSKIDSVEVEAGGTQMTVSGIGFCAWSAIPAPREDLGVSCGNIFNSNGSFYACGSVSSTPCTNSYGSCTSTNRFKGVVTEWLGAQQVYEQYAQNPPLRLYNPAGKV